jgi:hypothetical protein
VVVFVAVAALVLSTAGDYGITTDEPIYIGHGQRIAHWLRSAAASFGRGDAISPFRRNALDAAWYAGKDQQPPLVKVLSGVFSGLGGISWARAPGALLLAAACAALAWFCCRHWGREAGISAALALILMPRVFAHAHYGALDVPVASLVLLTALAVWKLGEDNRRRWAFAAGVLFGLALLAKLNAALLVPVLLIWSGVWQRKALAKKAVALCLIGPVVFVLGWPWLWHDLWRRLVEYVGFHVSHYPVDIYYLGHTYHYAPWHYPLVLTAVTLPLGLLLVAVIGTIFAVRSARKGKDEKAALFVICAASYLLVSSLPNAPKYNGVRLFMPAFPFIAGLVGVGFARSCSWLHERVGRYGIRKAWLTFAVGAPLFGAAAAAVAATHPYQLAYYNALVGGMRGARRLGFETVYWGGPYMDALPRLNERAGTVYVIPRGAISYLEIYQNAGALRRDLQFVPRSDDRREQAEALKRSELVVFQCSQSEFDEIAWALYRHGSPLWKVQMNGVPLLMAFDAREAERLAGGSAQPRALPLRSGRAAVPHGIPFVRRLADQGRLRAVYPEMNEILRFAQNDRRRDQNDRREAERLTALGAASPEAVRRLADGVRRPRARSEQAEGATGDDHGGR